jgi:glycine cleavage system H protein
MTTRPEHPECVNEAKPTASGAAPELPRGGFAVSADIGPVPAIYVPRSPEQATARAPLWRTAARTGRLARGWAAGLRHRVSRGGTVPDVPADLRYSKDHLWARPGADASLVRVGVTDFAQQSLGDVVAVTLPRAGDAVTAGEPFGDVESVKSVNDLIAPVTGKVRACNDDLTATPKLINTDPYGQGWMFEVETDPATLGKQLAALLDADAYRQLAGA